MLFYRQYGFGEALPCITGVLFYALKSPARRLLDDVLDEANRDCRVEVNHKLKYPLDDHKI